MTVRRVLRATILRLAAVLVLMLATIGGWEVYKGTVGMAGDASAANVFDHFTCYDLKPGGPPVNQTVTVTDQFHPQGQQVTVMGDHLLCTPAAKSQ